MDEEQTYRERDEEGTVNLSSRTERSKRLESETESHSAKGLSSKGKDHLGLQVVSSRDGRQRFDTENRDRDAGYYTFAPRYSLNADSTQKFSPFSIYSNRSNRIYFFLNFKGKKVRR